jgi:protein involved in sex pheromone biosynthesis
MNLNKLVIALIASMLFLSACGTSESKTKADNDVLITDNHSSDLDSVSSDKDSIVTSDKDSVVTAVNAGASIVVQGTYIEKQVEKDNGSELERIIKGLKEAGAKRV